MDLTPIKIIDHILKHHGVAMCVDLEICVSQPSSRTAAGLLCSTGLFEHLDTAAPFDNFTEYKRGIPRVRTTGWIMPSQTVAFFPASFYGLEPINEVILSPLGEPAFYISKELADADRKDIAAISFPRLAPFLKGLAQRFLSFQDDMAMIAVEQLVDGMNLDQAWLERHFNDREKALSDLILAQIKSKGGRIDYMSDNVITCYVVDQEEAENIRRIPGFDD
ncbi:hypothetical protein HIM_07503 [Hirsutella minnesotensis 3608]|uniref:Uncharacterized protein n=1 Tax=Hirsutella minnesotensis 3608 TaxID=1043627 RepID=A0A0F8A481_9HYPO|nr:hypothetical protein HIM_07503 [Hirsutella minnesotensis 3608]